MSRVRKAYDKRVIPEIIKNDNEALQKIILITNVLFKQQSQREKMFLYAII